MGHSIFLIAAAVIVAFLIARGGSRRGGGHQPRPLPIGVNRIRPPGGTEANTRYQIGGPRWPWDIRPRWLWNEMWALNDLPYGVVWADKLRAEIHTKYSGISPKVDIAKVASTRHHRRSKCARQPRHPSGGRNLDLRSR